MFYRNIEEIWDILQETLGKIQKLLGDNSTRNADKIYKYF